MKKICKFLVLGFLVAMLFSCLAALRGQYIPPIPEKKFFEAKFKIHICDNEEEFQEIVKFYYGSKNSEIVSLTITIKETGEKIIFIQKKQDGTIDLDDLGHEVWYHIIHDIHHPVGF